MALHSTARHLCGVPEPTPVIPDGGSSPDVVVNASLASVVVEAAGVGRTLTLGGLIIVSIATTIMLATITIVIDLISFVVISIVLVSIVLVSIRVSASISIGVSISVSEAPCRAHTIARLLEASLLELG